MLDKHSDASRLVERLRLKGLVSRSQCPADLRSVDIIISDAGLELLKKIDGQQGEQDKMMENLTEEEARKLNKLLDKLRG